MAQPRGEILRIAAGDLGSLISAPILRSHPGYDAKTLVRPFNLEIASKKLDEAGFRQESIGVPRIGQQGQPMNIRIGSNGRGQHLAEKMIRDAFASLGIKTEFIPIGQDGKNMAPEDLDGVFTGVEMPWPELDYESTLHSEQEALSGRFPFYRWNDKPLDEYLSGYHRSLLEGKPRFDLIQRIHQRWAELEPWTILLGHQVCVESLDVPLKTVISIADPDWFRRIVLD